MSNEKPTPTEGLPHAGWAGQSQRSYDDADSGGWGGPGRDNPTGPLPKLRRDDAEHRQVAYAPGVVGAHEASGPAAHDTLAPDASTPSRTGSAAGALASLFDMRFRTTATEAIAPIAFVLVMLYLFLDYLRSVYDYTSSADHFGPGAFAGVLVLLAVGLFKVIALTCVTRLALELCLHVARLARRA